MNCHRSSKKHSALAIPLISTVSDFYYSLRLQDVQTGGSLLVIVFWNMENHQHIYSLAFVVIVTSLTLSETET